MVFGVEIALWPIAAKKAGKWYRGSFEAPGRFMMWLCENEAALSWKRHASAMGGVQGNEERRGHSRRETAVGEKREGDDRQGSKVPGRLVGRSCLTLLVPQTAAAALNVIKLCLVIFSLFSVL